MIKVTRFSILWLLCALTTASASLSPNQHKAPVIDLGSLEIDGELRRPGVEWIDSQKKIKEWLPTLYSLEFTRLEETLLRPLSPKKLKQALEREAELARN